MVTPAHNLTSELHRPPPCLDWTRNPPPPNLTPFQQFIRDVDWSNSPLGPMEDWPVQLRQMMLIVVADPDPACIYWGKLPVIIYNEAYTGLIGDKHPSLQGSDASIGFSEIWDHFEQVLDVGRTLGKPVVEGNAFLLLHRHGYLEETYFSWKFVPIVGPDGWVVGSHATVVESTKEVIADRRLLTSSKLGTAVAFSTDIKDLWTCILRGLEHNDKDLPLVLLYSFADPTDLPAFVPKGRGQDFCVLEGTIGVESDHALAPRFVDVSKDEHPLAHIFRHLAEGNESLNVSTLDKTFPEELLAGIEWRGFKTPSTNFIAWPIKSSTSEKASGVLFAGLNPRRPYDSSYRTFVSLLAQQMKTPHVSGVILQEEIRRGRRAAQQAEIDREKLSQQLLLRTKEFEQSELKFTRFADRAAVGLALLNVSGQTIYANSTWMTLARLPNKDRNMSWMVHLVPEDKDTVRQTWNRLIMEKTPVKFQARFQGPPVKSATAAEDENASRSLTNENNDTSSVTSVICSAYPDLDIDGNIKTIMACITDVSELQLVEAKLRQRTLEVEQSEIKWRRFADKAPVGVVMVDKEGRIEFANDAWHETTGAKRENGIAMSWLDTMHPDDRDAAVALFQKAAAGSSGTSIFRLLKRWTPPDEELKGNIPDMNTHVLGNAYADLNSDGSVQHIVGWMTDISAQKMAEDVLRSQMEQAIEMKRQQEYFIDMTSHEMRNPLSAILHSTDEILAAAAEGKRADSKDTLRTLDEIVDATETIAYCVQHQKRIVDDILTLSKLDSNLLVVAPVPTMPVDVIHNALKIFEGELKTADIKLSFQIDPSIERLRARRLLLDPSRILQVFINLMTNAIKFTRSEATRDISIRLKAAYEKPLSGFEGITYYPSGKTVPQPPPPAPNADQQAIYLILSVQDTGRGLSPAETKGLFNRFQQATPKTHVKYGGSGLGLFVSRQLTEMQGGEIGVSSELGQGSTFSFYVETYRAAPEKESEKAKFSTQLDTLLSDVSNTIRPDSMVSTSTGKPKTDADQDGPSKLNLSVLVVEDNLVNQKVLSKLLRRYGCQVMTANHGKEALDILQRSRHCSPSPDSPDISVILMDLEMPVMDGLTTVQRIRELQRSGTIKSHIPVIAVTANARSKQVEEALSAGMDDVTIKPYNIGLLIRQISKFVQ